MRFAASDLFSAARPWQWVKNGVVLLPWIFGQRLDDPEATRLSLFAALAFCALSSATYLLNDVADRVGDARDPLRRDRAIASGRLPVKSAVAASIVAIALGFVLLLPVGAARGALPWVFAAGYLALTTSYSFALKRFPGISTAIVAAGFLLRVHAGGVAAGVVVSSWLSACTFLGALYVALEKRAGDARVSGAESTTRRRYEWWATVVGAAFVVVYALYTVAPRTREIFGSAWLVSSAIPLLLGVIRFHRVARIPGRSADPARIFLTDPKLLACVLLHAACCGFVLARWL